MSSLHTIELSIDNLNKEIAYFQELINNAPKGHLVCRKATLGNFRYSVKGILEDRNKEQYLPKVNINYARGLALREYARRRVADAKTQVNGLKAQIRMRTGSRAADEYLINHPGAAVLIEPMIRKRCGQLEEWKNAPYQRSRDFPEDLIYPTIVPDLLVRSKAEADILSRFEYFGVPYHYEEELRKGYEVIYPDFTCRNIQTGETFYWEHQGKWDDEGYVSRRVNKRNEVYCRMGIYPGVNLIISTETEHHPLDIQWVDQLIKYFLL